MEKSESKLGLSPQSDPCTAVYLPARPPGPQPCLIVFVALFTPGIVSLVYMTACLFPAQAPWSLPTAPLQLMYLHEGRGLDSGSQGTPQHFKTRLGQSRRIINICSKKERTKQEVCALSLCLRRLKQAVCFSECGVQAQITISWGSESNRLFCGLGDRFAI